MRALIIFFLIGIVKTNHTKTLELLQNPSFEIHSNNLANDWNTYNGNMTYNIICTNEPSSCSINIKKYNVTPFYGSWFILMNSFNNSFTSAVVYQKITVDIDVNRADTESIFLQLWYSSSGSHSPVFSETCGSPEIHVWLEGQHLYGGVANNTRGDNIEDVQSQIGYIFLNESVFQSWMEVRNGMEFMMELLMPNPQCSYIPYLAVDNVTLTWNYKSKTLFTENVLIIVTICCIIIITFCLAFFLIRRDNAKKRKQNYLDVPIFPSKDWIKYQLEFCKNCCHKEQYKLLH